MMKYNKVTELHMARLDMLNFFAIFTSKGIYPQPFLRFFCLREYFH